MADTPRTIKVHLDDEGQIKAVMNSGALGMVKSLKLTLQELPDEYRTFYSALSIVGNVEEILEREMR